MELLEKMRTRRTELLESRTTAFTALEAAAKPATEKRDLTAAETRRFDEARDKLDGIDQDIKDTDERIGELEAIESRTKAAAKFGKTIYGNSRAAARAWDGLDTAMTSDTLTGLRSRALDALEATRDGLPATAGDTLAGMVVNDPGDASARYVLATGDPQYRSAFAKLARNPAHGHLEFTPEELQAFARAQEYQRSAMAEGTTTTGGYMVPLQIEQTIILTNTGVQAAIRRIAGHRTTVGSAWAGISSAGVNIEWHSELGQVADASPTVALPKIPVYLADAFVSWSFELGDDADLVNQLAAVFADAKARGEETAFATGSGSGQPTGLITALAAATKTVTTATTTYAVADVYSLKAALPARYRANAGWLADESVYDLTRQFATGSGPQSAFWADFGEGTPPSLLGKPAAVSSAIDTVALTAGKQFLVYGDFSQYVIVDRVGAMIEFIPNMIGANGRPTAQRGALYWWRVGADCINTDGFRVLKMHA